MKAFRAKGSFRAGKRNQPFNIDLVAKDKDDAMERIMSNLGSRHRVSRRFVLVDEIKQIGPSDSVAPVVEAYFGGTDTLDNDPPAPEEE